MASCSTLVSRNDWQLLKACGFWSFNIVEPWYAHLTRDLVISSAEEDMCNKEKQRVQFNKGWNRKKDHEDSHVFILQILNTQTPINIIRKQKRTLGFFYMRRIYWTIGWGPPISWMVLSFLHLKPLLFSFKFFICWLMFFVRLTFLGHTPSTNFWFLWFREEHSSENKDGLW